MYAVSRYWTLLGDKVIRSSVLNAKCLLLRGRQDDSLDILSARAGSDLKYSSRVTVFASQGIKNTGDANQGYASPNFDGLTAVYL